MGIWGGHGSTRKGWEKAAKGPPRRLREDLIQVSIGPQAGGGTCRGHLPSKAAVVSSEALEV